MQTLHETLTREGIRNVGMDVRTGGAEHADDHANADGQWSAHTHASKKKGGRCNSGGRSSGGHGHASES